MHIFRGAIPFIAAVSLFGQSASKQLAPIHVFASNGMKAVILDLQPQAERALGRPLSIDFGSTTGLLQKINAGEPFDVAILTSDAIANLAKENKLTAATRTDLSRCGVGFAVRHRRSETGYQYSRSNETGSPESQIDRLREGWSQPPHGRENVRSPGYRRRAETETRSDDGVGACHGSRCIPGQTAVVLTLISELMPVHGIDIVGPLPADLQGYVSFGAAANSKTASAEAARALIAQLKTPTAAVYKGQGHGSALIARSCARRRYPLL